MRGFPSQLQTAQARGLLRREALRTCTEEVIVCTLVP